MATVEELKAELRAKKEASREAREAERVAEKALREALLTETGLAGCMVEVLHYSGRKTERFVVSGLGWSEKHVRGRIVKKDGSLGERLLEAGIDRVRNLGPYQPSVQP